MDFSIAFGNATKSGYSLSSNSPKWTVLTFRVEHTAAEMHYADTGLFRFPSYIPDLKGGGKMKPRVGAAGGPILLLLASTLRSLAQARQSKASVAMTQVGVALQQGGGCSA